MSIIINLPGKISEVSIYQSSITNFMLRKLS
ncbi:uncharacterized protein METZ01_LOCUS246778, partial [marine metagenome]